MIYVLECKVILKWIAGYIVLQSTGFAVTWCNAMLVIVTYPFHRWKLRFPSTATVLANKTGYSRLVLVHSLWLLVLLDFFNLVAHISSAVAYMLAPNLLSM